MTKEDVLVESLIKMVSDLITQRKMMPKGKLVYMGDKVSSALRVVIDERIEAKKFGYHDVSDLYEDKP